MTNQIERSPMKLSLPAAITLTDWSERTFWRKFADGSLTREMVNGKTLIDFASIEPHLSLPLEADDLAVLESADAGDAEAQNEMALILLSSDKAKGAIYWLELAAKQNHADAMSLLSQCHMQGNGVAKNENTGVMWLAKAAELGHVIAQQQMAGIRGR